MKTIPDQFKIKVSLWGDERRWCCRVGYHAVEFAASGDEVVELCRVSWSYAFTDIARTVRAYPWSLTVFQADATPRSSPYAVSSDLVSYSTFLVDVPHLFTVIQNACVRARKANHEHPTADLVLDIRRFQRKPAYVEPVGIVQLIRRFTIFERSSWHVDPVPRWRDWSRSLKPFSKMEHEAWAEFRHWLCQRNSTPGHRVWPAGDGEVGFNMSGISGAAICRGDDWSSHT